MALPDSLAGRDSANQSVVAGSVAPVGVGHESSATQSNQKNVKMLRVDSIWPPWPPSSVSEALVSGAAWASVCLSVSQSPLVSQLALPSVLRWALQSLLPLL